MAVRCKDKKPRILVEYCGKYTETHNIAYGIVAYSFFTRTRLLVTRCSNLIAFF